MLRSSTLLLALFSLLRCLPLAAQQDSIYLYSGAVPGAIPQDRPERWIVNPDDGVSLVLDVQKPLMYVHRPAKPNGVSVLICPGGGYYAIAMDHEGHQLAKWFNARGITAFVLKYRLPNPELMTQPHMRPLQDAQQALRIIRSRAAEWSLNPKQIGIMGFSAGGHLAATAGTHFNAPADGAADASVSVRPDFMILVYPLISFRLPVLTDPAADRNNLLLGPDPSQSLIETYSNELHITPQTPPAFLILAADDFIHPKQSLVFYEELRRNGVPAEMHIYGQGGHGFSLTQQNRGHVEQWDRQLEGWLRDRGLYRPLDAYERRSFAAAGGRQLPYRILYPEGYDRSQRYPLVLFLHGRGESGADNEKQLVHGASLFLKPEHRLAYPALVLVPQCPEDSYWANASVDRSTQPVTLRFDNTKPPTWPLAATADLLRQVIAEEAVDPARVYVTGLSMGGMGTFELVNRHPELFAAALPICGGGDAQGYRKQTKQVPFWIFHGDADAVVSVEQSREMHRALQALGAEVRYTEYPGVNHNSWDHAFADPAYLRWMFAQQRGKRKR
ncbi:MAG: prolyl oligopeptidase family serine peptidase [Bacteroidia bacterium]|nr:prolyl oligopeptidase family serine peptidase [Bacteroidia bacterium]